MKIKKLFKIFSSVERIRIVDSITFKELYFGDMGHLSDGLLEFSIDCARNAIDLKENKPILIVYVRKAEK